MISKAHKQSILIVDDDEVAQSLITKVLSMRGYRSVIADSAESALNLLYSGQWACVILELGIPGMGGLELLQIIKNNQPNLPVIIVTDEKKLESAVIAMKYHAANYLIKPVMPNDILNSIGEVIDSTKPIGGEKLEKEASTPDVWIVDVRVKFSEIGRKIFTEKITINLTGLETKIFRLLISRDPDVVTMNEIVALSQGYDVTNEEAAQIIRPTISRLNKKLEALKPEMIRIANVRGVGYFLEKMEIKHPN